MTDSGFELGLDDPNRAGVFFVTSDDLGALAAAAERVGRLPPVLEELQRLCRAAVRAQPANVQSLAEQPRIELEILIVRSETDPDDCLQFCSAHKGKLYGAPKALRGGPRPACGVRLICVTARSGDWVRPPPAAPLGPALGGNPADRRDLDLGEALHVSAWLGKRDWCKLEVPQWDRRVQR